MGIEAWGWGSALPLCVFSSSNKTKEKKWIKTVSWGVADMAFRPKHLKRASQATFQPGQNVETRISLSWKVHKQYLRSVLNVFTLPRLSFCGCLSLCLWHTHTNPFTVECACAHTRKWSLCTQTHRPYRAGYHLKSVCFCSSYRVSSIWLSTSYICVCVCQSQSCGWQPYLSSLGGRLSLLSAPHVSQANTLIHSAYLSSICLHYNHCGIIGFLPCSQIGTFISESYTVHRSALSYSLHLKRIRRQARMLHATHARATSSPLSTLGNKSCYCAPHGEVIKSTERGGEGRRWRENGPALPDSVCLKSDRPALLCEISDDIKRCFFFPSFFFHWPDDGGGSFW